MTTLTVAIWLDLRVTTPVWAWLHRVTSWRRRRDAEVARLLAPLPPERATLLPALEDTRHDWPVRLTPTDLAAAYRPRHAVGQVAADVGHQPAHAVSLSWTVDSAALRQLLDAERTYEVTA